MHTHLKNVDFNLHYAVVEKQFHTSSFLDSMS